MDRRTAITNVFAGSIGAAALAGTQLSAATAIEPKSKSIKKGLMKVGCQRGGHKLRNLEFLARHGVFNFDPRSPKRIKGVGWDLDDSLAIVEKCAKYGISVDAYHLPLVSGGIDRQPFPNIMGGKSPERDREIEQIQQMITVAGKSGVKVLNYNTTIHAVLRTGKTKDPLRGNALYSTWNYEEALKGDQSLTSAGVVDGDEMYERITYMLDRLVPVAEEYKVKLANHVADPPTPAGYRGITRWNSPDVFEGIKRFAQLYDSPFHGFNFCIGSIAEGLKDPATEIIPIIKWVGERKQIFNIHLRNIKGGFNNFQEVFPDNGEMDFFEIIKTLRDVEYQGMIMPDHLPTHEEEGSDDQAFAFAYGYIKAMIHAAENS